MNNDLHRTAVGAVCDRPPQQVPASALFMIKYQHCARAQETLEARTPSARHPENRNTHGGIISAKMALS